MGLRYKLANILLGNDNTPVGFLYYGRFEKNYFLYSQIAAS